MLLSASHVACWHGHQLQLTAAGIWQTELILLLMLSCAYCRYAREVEITNGRWAMLGFLAAITVEAATGKGILSQLIYYAKLSGLLGQQSGF